jgi:hypothetical protein
MFMHMPKKWGVPVLVAVALGLGAYYWLVLASERVGDWAVYQGSGRIARAESGPGSDYLDVSYTVRRPAKPLFSYTRLDLAPAFASPASGDREDAIMLTYRTEWPTTLLVVVTQDDGTTFRAPVKLEHSIEWTWVQIRESSFVTENPTAGPGGRRADFARVTGRHVDFYDGSGVTSPSTSFSNRLALLAPVIERVQATENP